MASKVFLVKGDNKENAVKMLLEHFKLDTLTKTQVALKANYNSADPFPAQTHLETLKNLIQNLKDVNVEEIILAERSGMGDTHQVLEKSGVTKLAQKLKFNVQILDDLPLAGWVHFDIESSHWNRGFLLAKIFSEVNTIIQTCCLKTHQFGGHFTLSLKNSVGMIARYNPQDGYDYMGELHGSLYQRQMIAEINTSYDPYLILMDGTKAFTKGGPANGQEVTPNVFLASSDRIAIDAAGIAILRHYGTTSDVAHGTIFSQGQLARAIELGLGAKTYQDLDIIPLDNFSEQLAEHVRAQFNE